MSTAEQITDTTLQDTHALSITELEARMFDGSAPEDEVTTTDELDPEATSTTDTEVKGDTAQADSSAAPAAAQVEEVKPDGVLAKDEKHILPFKVVEDLRTRNAELERVAREQAAQIDVLKSAKADGTPDADVLKDHEFLSDEQLASLEEELPTLAKTLRTQQAALKTLLTDRATDQQQREQVEEQALLERQNAARTAVQDAIDSTPKLSHLFAMRTTDPMPFQRAKEIDQARENNPETGAHWKSLPLADRFAQVMVDYEAKYGAVEVPSLPTKDSPAPATTAAAPAAQPTAPKPKPHAGPLSLSDLPGGAAPAADQRSEMENMSPAEIISRQASWTPAQLESYYAQL